MPGECPTSVTCSKFEDNYWQFQPFTVSSTGCTAYILDPDITLCEIINCTITCKARGHLSLPEQERRWAEETPIEFPLKGPSLRFGDGLRNFDGPSPIFVTRIEAHSEPTLLESGGTHYAAKNLYVVCRLFHSNFPCKCGSAWAERGRGLYHNMWHIVTASVLLGPPII